MFFGLQPWHIAVIVIVALLIFGPRRLPEVGRWVGKSITEFRKGSQEMTSALREGMNEGQQAEAQKNSIAQPAPTQSVPVGDSKFCIKCGSTNPKEALFCNKCGNPFQPQA